MDNKTNECILNKKVINLTWAGIGFSALYWFFESFRDVILFEKGSLFERIFFPDPMSFWMRLLVVSIIILFGVHAESHRKRYEHCQIKKPRPVYSSKILLISFSYSVLYWVLESVRDTFVFEKGDILHTIFNPGPMGLWMRLLTVFIIILFSLYYQTLIDERRKMIEQFRKEQDYLEKKVEERTSELTKTLARLKKETNEKDEIQGHLFHSQKMEAIGLLAGGIAHDFGNLLQGIRGVAEAAMMDIDETSGQHHNYKQILDLAKIASRVVHKIVHFSRKQPMKFYSMNLNTIVEDSGDMVNRWIGQAVTLKTELDPDLWLTNVNYTALEQVILNMAINAKDAMPEGGRFIIKTENKEMDEIESGNDANYRLCKCVCLSFSDTGSGMDSETLKHIFEPYFTTKDSGNGTGLGLSVVYGIVKQHNGWIRVESKIGKGTTFKIFFPSQAKTVEDEIPDEIIYNEFYENDRRILIEDTKKKLADQSMNA